MTVSVVVWGQGQGIADRLERLRGSVTVVRNCTELIEVIALAETGLADAALLAGESEGIDATVIDALRLQAVPAVVLTDDAAEGARLAAIGAHIESPGASEQALSDLLELLSGSIEGRPAGTGQQAAEMARPPVPEREPGRILAIWGPPGSPGRTLVAVNAAAEAAVAGQDVVLLDADTYGASVAVHLGLLDESAGIAQLCRLSDQGVLDPRGFERACSTVAVGGAKLRVLTGLPRPNRWPEVRAATMGRVLDFVRRRADLVVVDVAPFLELDEDLSFDTSAPQRNAATLAVLGAADSILAVGAADSIGVPRLVKGLEELLEQFPGAAPRVVFNKVRSTAVGPAPERQLRETWERFGPRLPVAAFLPWDNEAADRALLEGSALVESAPGSELRRGVAGLVSVRVHRRAGLFRR